MLGTAGGGGVRIFTRALPPVALRAGPPLRPNLSRRPIGQSISAAPQQTEAQEPPFDVATGTPQAALSGYTFSGYCRDAFQARAADMADIFLLAFRGSATGVRSRSPLKSVAQAGSRGPRGPSCVCASVVVTSLKAAPALDRERGIGKAAEPKPHTVSGG